MLKDRLVVLTEEEYEAQARKQVPAEVIAEARASLSESLDAEERLTEPPAKHRFAEWCGENFAAIWYEFSLLRDELGLPQPECDEEASGSDPAPAPDFASMTPDDLRAWLDERGRRWTWNSSSCGWAARLDGNDFNSTIIARTVDHPTEPAALLALCQKVAAKEASC